jgi:3-hydroxybutyryl-CoA dehydrogenase
MNAGFKTVTVLGAGTMGHGIALIFARAGLDVFLTDISEEVLAKAKELIRSHLQTLADCGEPGEDPSTVMKHITTTLDYKAGARQSDLVVEAIVEDTEAKRKLFRELAAVISDSAIVASNTSYLNIFPLAPEKLQKRLVITHFFNPPYIVPLVEIVGSAQTNPGIPPQLSDWLNGLGMVAVVLKKFVPGFIVNRLQRAIGREVLHMIDEGFADPEEIDRAVKASLGVRTPILGVVARYDFAGLDMAIRALKAPSLGLASEDRMSPTLVNLVNQGHLGVKSGKGFFDYSDKPLTDVLKERDLKLIQVRKLLRQLGEIR